MTDRKFHKTIIQVEVLSEDPFEYASMEQLGYAIGEGDCSGRVTVVSQEELDGKQAADALMEQDSDPSFFNLTEQGEDDDDYDN